MPFHMAYDESLLGYIHNLSYYSLLVSILSETQQFIACSLEFEFLKDILNLFNINIFPEI